MRKEKDRLDLNRGDEQEETHARFRLAGADREKPVPARRQGHQWMWESAAAAIGREGTRTRGQPAPTTKLPSLDVEAAC